ncbi:hypothetical protein [Rhodalgimonas zhirmunskyi]|uniref:hypothetical protein n=1 Tax=Rhodalgimonas zhirmunskyi TaxID=2964767 RepID=UPI002952949E|nr:hypothetical protein [Rhodoalgimonas zhirmunskyi]
MWRPVFTRSASGSGAEILVGFQAGFFARNPLGEASQRCAIAEYDDLFAIFDRLKAPLVKFFQKAVHADVMLDIALFAAHDLALLNGLAGKHLAQPDLGRDGGILADGR